MAYLTVAEFKALQLQVSVQEDIGDDYIQANLNTASSLIDSFMLSQVKLPLVTIPDIIKDLCSSIAAYKILSSKGFPVDGLDANYKFNYDEAYKWLMLFSQGKVSLGQVDSSPSFEEGGTYVSNNSSNFDYIISGSCNKSSRWDY